MTKTISKRISGLGTVKIANDCVVAVVLTQARSYEAGLDGREVSHLDGPALDAAGRDLRRDIEGAVKQLAPKHTIVDEVEVIANRPGMQPWTARMLKGFGA